MPLLLRQRINNRIGVAVAKVDEPVLVHGVLNGADVGASSPDERPVDAIDDWVAVCAAPMHKPLVIDGRDDMIRVERTLVDESVLVNHSHNRVAVRATLSDVAPSFPVAVVRLFHIQLKS